MKVASTAAMIFALFSTCVAFAQSGTPTPPAPPAPPVPPASPEPTAGSQPKVAEGVLMKSQRASGDKGTFEWICTYRVAGTTRNVQVDESCPQTMPFALKR
jgi:hypothetical protein